jgi:hypothetical protein
MAPRRSWAKASNPFWSAHVAARYRIALEAENYCRGRDLSTATSMLWARHLLNAEDLRKGAEDLQKLRRKERERQSKNRQPRRRRRLHVIATACARTAVRLLFGRSGACRSKR